MLYLPRNLGKLADIAATENPRYAITGVKVTDPRDGTYRLDVTDGRRLLVVRGNLPDAPPEYVGLKSHPDWFEAVIPSQDWRAVFKWKDPEKGRNGPLALALGDPCQFVNEPGAHSVLKPSPLQGRYPPVDSVLPKRPPLAGADVDPALLAGLLSTIASLGVTRVRLLFWKKDAVLAVVGRNDEGQYVDGVIMPLS